MSATPSPSSSPNAAEKDPQVSAEHIFNLSGALLVEASFDGRFKRINPAWARLLGWTVDELTSQPWLHFVHVDDRASTIEAGERLKSGIEVVNFENRYRHRDGSWRWISWNCTCSLQEQTIFAVAQDVTQRKQSEVALQASEARHRLLFENSPLASYVFDATTFQFKAVNSAALKLYGYERDAFLALTMLDIRPQEDLALARKVVQQLFDSSEVIAIHRQLDSGSRHRHQRSDGELLYVEPSVLRIEWLGSPCFLVTVVDITERVRTEDELRKSEAFNRSLMEGSVDCIKVLDAEGTIRHMNSAGLCLLEVDDAADVVGCNWPQLWPFEQRSKASAALAAALRGDSASFQGFCPTAQGSPKWWDVAVSPLRNSQTGKVSQVLAVSHDITARRASEQAVRESEERLTIALGAGQLGDWEIDLQSMRLTMSPTGKAHYGRLPHEEFCFEAFHEAIHPDDRALRDAAFAACVQDVGHYEAEYRVYWPDGSLHWISSRGKALPDQDGRAVRVIGVTTDVSEQKRSEQLLREADRRKDEFLATLAHELRNPLAPINNAVQLMKVAGGESQLGKLQQILERQVSHMVRLVDDLMEVSRISQGKIELRRTRIDLREVVDAAVESSRPLIEQASHSFRWMRPSQPLHVHGDSIRLTQVVVNLLNNAARYTDPGGQVELTAGACRENALVEVSDNGIGIEQDQMPELFNMFSQGDARPDRPRAGLGVGLGLAAKLVEMHGGRIDVHSEGRGRGSRFSLSLPLVAGQDAAPLPLVAPPEPRRDTTQRVLIVDDNVDAADTIAELLRFEGCEVRTCYGGRDALQLVDEWRPTTMLIDLGMADVDGYQVAKEIRSRPRLDEVKLLALTGWGQIEDKQRTRATGFDHHLVKPVDFLVLLKLLSP